MPITTTVTIGSPLGLHARPAALFVQTASKFPCEVFVEREGLRINGKSIMGVMMLAAEQGAMLTIEADGDEAQACLEALTMLIDSGFETE